jgi:hypothetical protein
VTPTPSSVTVAAPSCEAMGSWSDAVLGSGSMFDADVFALLGQVAPLA